MGRGASPVAQWLTLHAGLQQPVVRGSDPWRGPAHRSSSHAVAACNTDNRGRLAIMLAQGQSSLSKRGRLVGSAQRYSVKFACSSAAQGSAVWIPGVDLRTTC